jgi:hypothetical protein
MTLQPAHKGLTTEIGVLGGSSELQRPDSNDLEPPADPGGNVEAVHWTRHLVFTLCNPQGLYEVTINAKPHDKDFDTKVFSDIEKQYFKARGRWTKFLGRYAFWDISELRVVQVLSCDNVD